MPYPPLTQFETRQAALKAQLTRLAELRAHLHAAEASRSSSCVDGEPQHTRRTARLRTSETT